MVELKKGKGKHPSISASFVSMPVPLKTKVAEIKQKQRGKPLSTKQKEDIVRQVCTGKLRGKKESCSRMEMREAHEIARIYSLLLTEYYGVRPIDWKMRFDQDKRIASCCCRAAAQAKVMGITPEDYLKAQFWASNEVFNRAPYQSEIASLWSFKRYEQWYGIFKEGKAPKKVVHISIRGYLNPKKTQFAEEERYHEWILNEMIKMYGSEEEVWKGIGADEEETFPDWFKYARPKWQEVFKKQSKKD